jgi:hypothetical protein
MVESERDGRSEVGGRSAVKTNVSQQLLASELCLRCACE